MSAKKDEVGGLYQALIKKGYTTKELGNESTFRNKMADKDNRKQLYDYVSNRGDFRIGDYENYENRLSGYVPQPEQEDTSVQFSPVADIRQQIKQAGENISDSDVSMKGADTTTSPVSAIRKEAEIKLGQEKTELFTEEELANSIIRTNLANNLNEQQSYITKDLDEVKERLRNVGGTGSNAMNALMGSSQYNRIAAPDRKKQGELEAAQNLLSQSENIIEESKKKGNTTFVSGLGRGVKDAVFNPDTWTFGLSELAGNKYLLDALNKADNNQELSSSEQKLLDAAVTNMAVNAYYGSMLGRGYKAGKVTGESIPFMLEFALNPVSASGNAIAKNILRYGIRRFGKTSIKKGAVKMAARLAGDAAAAGAMTATTGAARVASGSLERQQGDIQYGFGDDLSPEYTGRENVKSGTEALAKSAASTFLENQSEMIFNAFKGISKPVWNAIERNLPEGVAGFLSKASSGKAAQLYRDIKNNPLLVEVARRTQFHGVPEEYLEEVYNNFASIPLGDMTLEEATDLDNNIDTFLGVAPTSVAFSMLGLGGLASQRISQQRKMQKNFGEMSDEQRKKFLKLEELSRQNGNQDIREFIKQTLADNSLSNEEKKKEIEYAYDIALGNAIDEADNARLDDMVTQQSVAAQEGMDIYQAHDPVQMRQTVLKEDISKERLVDAGVGEEAISQLVSASPEERINMLDNMEEGTRELATDYLVNHERRAALDEAIDSAHEEEVHVAESRLNDMGVSASQGNIYVVPLGKYAAQTGGAQYGVVLNGLTPEGIPQEPGGRMIVAPVLMNPDGTPDFNSVDVSKSLLVTSDMQGAQVYSSGQAFDSMLKGYVQDVSLTQSPEIVPGATVYIQGKENPEPYVVLGNDNAGNVILTDNSGKTVTMPDNELRQKVSDTERLPILAEYGLLDEEKEQISQEASRQSYSNDVLQRKPKAGDTMILEGKTAQIKEVTPDGLIVDYLDEDGNVNGVDQIPEDMYYRYMQDQEDLRRQQQPSVTSSAVSQEVLPQQSENTVDAVQSQQDTVDENTALARIPYNDKSEHDFEAADAADTAAALLEISENDIEDAKDTAMQMVQYYTDQLKKAEKAKTTGTNIQDIVRLKQQKKENIRSINAKIGYWNDVISGIESKRLTGLIADAEAVVAQNQARLDAMSPEERRAAQEAVQRNIDSGAYEKKKPVSRIRYSREDQDMGPASTPLEHVLREIATGRVSFLWGDKGATKGLGSHLGLASSNDERKKIIWALSNDGMTPEAAAEIIHADMPENLQGMVSDTDIFNMILDAFQEYATPSRMWDTARSMHGTDIEQNLPGYDQDMERQALEWEAAQNRMSVPDWIAYCDIVEEELNNYLSAFTDDDINTIFEQFNENYENERSGRNQERSTGSIEESPDNSRSDVVLQEEGSDNAEAGTGSERQGSQSQADGEGGSMVPEPGQHVNDGPVIREVNIDSLFDNLKKKGTTKLSDNFVSPDETVLPDGARIGKINEHQEDFSARGRQPSTVRTYRNAPVVEHDGVMYYSRESKVVKSGKILNSQQGYVLPVTQTNDKDIIIKMNDYLQDNHGINIINYGWEIGFATPISDTVEDAEKFKNILDEAYNYVSQSKVIEEARQEVDQNPTEAQKKAGNYRKGHVSIDGFDISIENPKGSVRSGKDADGNEWSVTMNNDYGYIRGTEGVDGDHIDFFLSDDPGSGQVYVIDQVNKDGSFDEHKVMYGFKSALSAKRAYLANYSPGWTGLGNITSVSKEEFKKWISSSNRKTKPFSEYKSVNSAQVPSDKINISFIINNFGKTFSDGNDTIAINGYDGAKKTVSISINEDKKVIPVTDFFDMFKNGQWEEIKPAKPSYGSSNKIVSTSRYEELKKLMRDKLNQLNAGFDPQMFAIGAEMAAYHIEAGARKFADFARKMIEDMGDKIRPYLKSFYNGARDFPGMDSIRSEMSSSSEVEDFDVFNFDKEKSTVNPPVFKVGDRVISSKDGRVHTIMMVIELGEQQTATTFSKPVVERYYFTDMSDATPEEVQAYNDPVPPKPLEELSGNSVEYESKSESEKSAVKEIGVRIMDLVSRKLAGEDVRSLTMKDIKDLLSQYPDLSGMSSTDMQELVELAVTNLARDISLKHIKENPDARKKAFDAIVSVYEMQPLLNARDSSRFEKQQYSTPVPFGYVMGQFVNANRNIGSVLEPSAGNGALTITFPGSIVHVNDIDERRLANLRTLGYREVTNRDGLLPFPDENVDAVMTNPPFGSTTAKEFDNGKIKISSLEGLMAINALDSMKDNGRAAIVIGGNTSYRENGAMQSKDMKFFAYLYTHYNVIDVINLDGEMYKRNGTKYDVRIILIDGRKKGPFNRLVAPPVKSKARAEQVKTFDELYNRVQDDIRSVQQMGDLFDGTAGETRSTDAQSGGENNTGGNRPKSGERRESVRRGQAVRPSDNVGSSLESSLSSTESGGQQAKEDAGTVDNGNRSDAGSTTPVQEPEGRSGRSVSRSDTGERRTDGSVSVDTGNNAGRSRLSVNLGDEKVPYPNRSQSGTLMSVVPANQAQVLADSLANIGDVDQFLVDELGYSGKNELFGYLAAEQIDSVSLAINQMNKDNGFIIGDMTGVGKGRQGAALIRYAVNKGFKPIYFTQKPALFSDNYRDLSDIGSSNLRPFIIASDPKNASITDASGNIVHKLPSDKEKKRVFDYILKNGTLPDEYDYVITTYSQINNGTKEYEATDKGIQAKDKSYKKKSPSAADKSGQERRNVIQALAKNNIMILDESHTVGGSGGGSMFMQYIMPDVKGATFLSATFAKRADNMPIYAMKTDLGKSGVSQQEMIQAIAQGGVTLQEIMSKQLVQSGQMIRRERDFSGVTIDWLPVSEKEDAIQRTQFDEVSSIFSDIRAFQKDYITPMVSELSDTLADEGGYSDLQQGTKELGVTNTPFASKMYNLVNQLLFALKADAVSNRVIYNLQNGFKPVISFTNTMEGFLDEAPKDTPMDKVPNFSATLMRALDGVMRYTVNSLNGEKESYMYDVSELSEEGQNRYREIKEKIENLSANLPISPMDAIKMKIEDAGYKVGEITGRTLEMVKNPDGKYVVQNRKDKDKKAAARDFNNGKLDVLMINKSGSTGLSLHASPKFEDQRQRVMVFAQFQSDINDEVQMRGRIDRTGQIFRGKYEYIMSSIPAEQRLQMMFKAKLKSLDANTTSSQKSKFNEMEVVDFLNKYGDEVTWQYMLEHPEISERLGDPLNMLSSGEELQNDSDNNDSIKKEGSAAKIARYLPFLPVAKQEEVFNEITEAYQFKIQLLNDAGENDLEITTMPLKAKTLNRKIWKQGTEPGSGNAFADNTYLEEVEVDILKKPMKADAIKKTIEKMTEGMPWEEWKDAKEKEINEVYDGKINLLKERLTERANVSSQKAKKQYIEKAKKAREKQKNEFTDEEIDTLSEEVVRDINKKADEIFRKQKDVIEARRENMLNQLKAFTPSKVVVIPLNLNEDMATLMPSRGMFLGFRFSKDFSPSSSTAVFATMDGRRKVEIPFSQNKAFSSIRMNTMMQPTYLKDVNIDTWDSFTPETSRKKAYIITGNLLQALVDIQKNSLIRGYLVSYSTDTGETKQGILMSDSFKPDDLTSSTPISSRLIQIQQGETVISEDKRVIIERNTGWRSGFALKVPKSKKLGGEFFEDNKLRYLADNKEFTTRGMYMVADIPADNLAKVLDRLSAMGVKVAQKANLKDENKSSSNGVRYRFIGEIGAANIDNAEEASIRLDNLMIAKDLENSGTDERNIKIATGWERGADGLWRYEEQDGNTIFANNPDDIDIYQEKKIANLRLKEIDAEINNARKNKDRTKIETLINEDELVRTRLANLTALDFVKDSLPLGTVSRPMTLRYVLDNETYNRLTDAYPELANIKVYLVKSSELTGKSGYYDLDTKEIVLNDSRNSDLNTTLLHEIQHAIQDIEGFQTGSNPQQAISKLIEVARVIDPNFNDINYNSIISIVENEYFSTKIKKELNRIATDNGFGNVIDYVRSLNPIEYYARSAGEVEARNVIARMNMSIEQRRLSLASDTEDVARKDQIFIRKALDPATDRENLVREIQNRGKNLNVLVTVISSVDDIDNEYVRSSIEKGNAVKGWYDTSTGRIYLYLPNCEGVEDAEATILHEGVAHYGLRQMIGEDRFGNFLDDVYQMADKDVRDRIDSMLRSNGYDIREATEECLASIAEKGIKNPSFWQKIKNLFKRMLRAIGLNGKLNDNDLQYILWESYRKLRASSYPVDIARSTVMRNQLGINQGRALFRQSSNRPKQPEIIEEYDNRIDSNEFNFQETFQDSMLSLKILQELIEEYSGKKARSFENAYTAENRLSSINRVDNERFIREMYNPLVEYIRELAGKTSINEVENYIYAKSGLERNDVFTKRDAENTYNESVKELEEKLAKGDINEDQFSVLMQNSEKQKQKQLAELKDYAGLKGLIWKEKGQEYEEQYNKGEIGEEEYNSKRTEIEKDYNDFAQQIVSDFESKVTSAEYNELWKLINASTNYILDKQLESGLLSQERYDSIKEMMQYYVPMRGWAEDIAEDVYDYERKEPVIKKKQKKAKGRESLADNPIATIASMAQSAIVAGNRNKMKQRFFNFVVNRPNPLATVGDVWYARQPDGSVEKVFPQIKNGQSGEEIQQLITEFEQNMSQYEEQGTVWRGKLPLNIGLKFKPGQKSEHIVTVMINGREYAIYINGNPRAAMALNGETNSETEENVFWSLYNKMKRLYGGGLTSYNPDFVIPNFVRDSIHSATMQFLDKGFVASARYIANIPSSFKAVSRGVAGIYDPNNQMDVYFKEFVDNGGETGYTAIHTLEDYKKEYDKIISDLSGVKAAIGTGKKNIEKLVSWMESANRIAEDVNRFNAYVSSRQSGLGVEESVNAAKNITVNFNKKGSGAKGKGMWAGLAYFLNKWVLFLNPSIQGIYQVFKSARINKKRAISTLLGVITSGFLMPYLNELLISAFGGSDDDDYFNQTDYTRMNNWLFWTPAGYIKIPLPPFFRELYGVGDILHRSITGRMTADRAAVSTLRQIQSLIGFINLIPEGEPSLREAVAGLMPDLMSPFMDIALNRDFTGRDIAKDSPYTEYLPEYERIYKGVSPVYIDISRFLNQIGGDDARRSPYWGSFINPAYMEHFVLSYSGGIGKTFSNTVGMAIDAATGNTDNIDFRQIPVANRFFNPSSDRNVMFATNRIFYQYQVEYEQARLAEKRYKQFVKDGQSKFEKELEQMKNNGEIEFINYFSKKLKTLKRMQNRLMDNPDDKKLEKEITEFKQEMIMNSKKLLK